MRALLAVTLGALFFLLPLLCYLCSGVFLLAYLRREDAATKKRTERWEQLQPVLRDPLRVGTILFLSGVAVMAMIGGDFGLADYASTPLAALEVAGDAFTNWNDPLSSRAIAVRGGVFIVLLCCVAVAVSLVSYFRRRWDDLDEGTARATH